MTIVSIYHFPLSFGAFIKFQSFTGLNILVHVYPGDTQQSGTA